MGLRPLPHLHTAPASRGAAPPAPLGIAAGGGRGQGPGVGCAVCGASRSSRGEIPAAGGTDTAWRVPAAGPAVTRMLLSQTPLLCSVKARITSGCPHFLHRMSRGSSSLGRVAAVLGTYRHGGYKSRLSGGISELRSNNNLLVPSSLQTPRLTRMEEFSSCLCHPSRYLPVSMDTGSQPHQPPPRRVTEASRSAGASPVLHRTWFGS